MKTHPALALIAGLGAFTLSAPAQPTSPPPSAPPAGTSASVDNAATPSAEANANLPQRSAEQLEQLLGPIALYPDALIAIILPAAASSSDVVLAARYLAGPNDTAQIDQQPWDESVRSLARYPEVVKWMDENLEWTKQVGESFVAQPADVMNTIQRLRAQARAAGTLVDTPQQQVVTQDSVISIVPAEPEVIYVPRYDPAVVFVERRSYYGYPLVTFGPPCPVGIWLSFDCDWRQRRVWIDHRYADSRYHRDLRRPFVYPTGPHFAPNLGLRPWQPRPNFARAHFSDPNWGRREVVRPAPLPGTPARPGNSFRSDDRRRWTDNPANSAPPARSPISDGRNHGTSRWRSGPDNIAQRTPPATSPVASSPGRTPPAVNPAVPAPSFASPGTNPSPATNRTDNGASRSDWNRRDRSGRSDQTARTNPAPNYRAGAIERPRTSTPPAPGSTPDRSAWSRARNPNSDAPRTALPAPRVSNASSPSSPRSVSAPPSSSGGSSRDSSDHRGGRGDGGRSFRQER